MKLLQILHKHKMKKSSEIDVESSQSTSEKEKTEQSKELLNKHRLLNLINKVKELCRSSDFEQRKAVFYIVKIYADKINCDNNTDVLESQIDKRPFQDATSYSKFYFDGTYYRDKQSDEIIEKNFI